MNPMKCLNPVAATLIAIETMLICAQTQGAPALNACSLLTPAQVGAVLGTSVGAGLGGVSNICIWRGTPPKRVLLTLHPPGQFAALKTPIGGVTKVAVGGVGDDAVSGTDKGATTLSVKKGDVVFVITVAGFPDEQIKSMEKALALNIVAKL